MAVATAAQPAPQVKPDTRPVLEITRNTKLDPVKKYGAIVIKASNITVDGGGAWLTGAHPELDPKDYKRIAISAGEVSGVTLKNINAKGWDVALKIQHGSNWTIEDCDFSDNYTIRLGVGGGLRTTAGSSSTASIIRHSATTRPITSGMRWNCSIPTTTSSRTMISPTPRTPASGWSPPAGTASRRTT